MSALARPAVLAAVLAAGGLVLHPGLGAAAWLPGRPGVLAALLLVGALAFVARAAAARDTRAALLAAGALTVVAAVGVDGVLGRHGRLALAPGGSRPHFDETGPDGRSLGLRPLGFVVGALAAPPGKDAVVLALPGREAGLELTPGRSLAFGGYRFAGPRVVTTGGAARLRVAASDGARTLVADVASDAPGRAGDLTIVLDEFFPDFALDERQQPYSRSSEPRNPAALLSVRRGGQAYRAFVLRSMPGVHRVEGLGLSFSLLDVEAERSFDVAVHREPAALAALAGALLLLAGVLLSRGRDHGQCDPRTPPLVAGAVLVSLLALTAGVLAWTFGAPGRVVLPGVGVLLGAALLAALAGSLLLAASRLADAREGVPRAGRGALWAAVLLVAAGVALATVRLASLPPGTATIVSPLAGLGLAAGIVALSLLARRPAALASRALPFVVALAVALAAAAGVVGVLRSGTYATPAATAAAASALLGLAALEPTRVPGLRRFAFLFSLIALAVA
jgi:hypothetical protein